MSSPYADSVPVPCVVSADGVIVHAGQIWQNKLSNFDSLFVVTSTYQRSYVDGKTRPRVSGVLIASGSPQYCDPSRSLDVESLFSMYPFNHFEPYKPIPEEDK